MTLEKLAANLEIMPFGPIYVENNLQVASNL